MRRLRSSVFRGRDELLLVRTLTFFLTFMVFPWTKTSETHWQKEGRNRKSHNRSPTLCSKITFLLNRLLGSVCWNIFRLNKDISFRALRSLGNSIGFLSHGRPNQTPTVCYICCTHTHPHPHLVFDPLQSVVPESLPLSFLKLSFKRMKQHPILIYEYLVAWC